MRDRIRKVIEMEPPAWCPDARCSTSRMTVFNNEEILIENFRHVIYSHDERISVKTKKGILNIYGTGLHIDYYTNYEIKIYGVISSVDWLTV